GMYINLFLRTFSQALQAFTPIAFGLTWFERTGDSSMSSAIRRGLIVSLPATGAASWLFKRSTHTALDEALLAVVTVGIAALFARTMWQSDALCTVVRRTSLRRVSRWTVAMLTALIVV